MRGGTNGRRKRRKLEGERRLEEMMGRQGNVERKKKLVGKKGNEESGKQCSIMEAERKLC